MSGRRGNMDPFFGFGDPFAGFGGHQSLVSSFFGGRDPFDDPFFTHPFGGMFDSPFGPGRNMSRNHHPGFFNGNAMMSGHPTNFPMERGLMNGFQSGFSAGRPFMNQSLPFGFSSESPLMNAHPSGFFEGQPSQVNRSRGPIIEEVNSDEEEEIESNGEKKDNPRKHGRSSNEPYVEDPDEEIEERNRKQLHYDREITSATNSQPRPQAQSFTFQSSTVSYGGSNGAYYTKSRTMRTGSDGLTIDESKEADSTTGRATHKLSRGIYDKGHTVTRKLESDGRVDTMQVLHNLDEGDLSGFEETWKGKARTSLPGWSEGYNLQNGSGSSSHSDQQSRVGWALPSTERPHVTGPKKPDGRTKANIVRRKDS